MDQWNKFAKAATLLAILASVFVCIGILYGIKSIGFIGSAPSTNTISVSGHGESFAVPDIATLSFSVEKTSKTVSDAQSQVTTTMNDAIATLKTLGVADNDIQTTSYDVYPKYDYTSAVCTANIMCPPSKQVLSGYTVSDTVQVKIRAIDKSGDVLAALGQKNVTNVSGLTFSVEDDTAVTTDARNKAIAEAKAQAQSIAKGLGVQLVRITDFSESTGATPIYYSKDMVMAAGASAPVAAPSIPVGENKSSSDVTITYEIQ